MGGACVQLWGPEALTLKWGPYRRRHQTPFHPTIHPCIPAHQMVELPPHASAFSRVAAQHAHVQFLTHSTFALPMRSYDLR